jgi:hypothetical protein
VDSHLPKYNGGKEKTTVVSLTLKLLLAAKMLRIKMFLL